MAASFVRYKSRTCPFLFRFVIGKSRRTRALGVPCQYAVQPPTPLFVLSRAFSTPAEPSTPVVKAPSTVGSTQPTLEDDELFLRERYIPITRQSLIRIIMQEKDFLTESEKKIFPDFALALDSALVNKYHSVLQELKALFDPINPDKETQQTRGFSRRDKLENEFWLLQRLEDVMDKANFTELPRPLVDRMLKEHETTQKVKVSVDPSRYAVLRFWVLGQETPEIRPSLRERLTQRLMGQPARTPLQYFKRVVVAIRLNKDSKLVLKAFKEVPVDSMEMLLPDGTIQMSALDKSLVVSTGAIAAIGLLAKTVTSLANVNVDWTLVLTALTGIITFRVWSAYKNRRNSYLVEVSRLLYFKNIANNRGLLTLLVDRAEDESFKEALLTYSFLLHSRPQVYRNVDSFMVPKQNGLTDEEMKGQIETWVKEKFGVSLDFDTSEAVRILRELGLLSTSGDKHEVLLLPTACHLLPQSPQSLIARRNTEGDIVEGYDRDEFLETEEEYREQDERARRYGWF